MNDSIVNLSLAFCDTVQAIRAKYAAYRLDWAIIRVFSWHALATELSLVLGDDVISNSVEAKSAREKIARVFRDRPSIDYLKGNDSLWQPLERLRAELELRTSADNAAALGYWNDNGAGASGVWSPQFRDVPEPWTGEALWQTF